VKYRQRIRHRARPDGRRETRTQQFQQLNAFLPTWPTRILTEPAASDLCCLHKRIIARRLRYAKAYGTLSTRSDQEWLLP
jgi:hypothetical protein